MLSRRHIVLALLLLGVGLVLRAWGLPRFPFEQDELYTLQESRELFQTTLRPGIDARPLYYLLHHRLLGLLPDTEAGARLPAFVFGALGLVVTWRLGLLVAGSAGGLLALFLAVISPWHLYVSGMARYWSAVYLLSATALFGLLRAHDGNRWRHHLLAGAALVAGSLTHPTFMFTAVGFAVGSCLETDERGLRWRWPTRRAWLGTWLPAALLVGGYLLFLKLGGRGQAMSNWGGRGLVASLRLVPAIVQLAGPALVAAALGGLAAALAWGTPTARRFALLAMPSLLAGTGLLCLASTRTDVYADYGVTMLPLLCVGTTGAVFIAATQARRELLGGFTALALAGDLLPGMVSQLSDGMRFDYRPAFEEIRASDAGAPVLAWPLVTLYRYAPDLRAIELRYTQHQLDSLAAAGKPFWVVTSVQRYGMVKDSDGQLTKWLREHCHQRGSYERWRLDYRRYAVQLHRCP